MRSRSRARRQGIKANIDMNSLIDLTFLLLVVFIVTLPTLEHTVPILLPTDKPVEQRKDKDQKPIFVNVDHTGKYFIGDTPTTLEDLKTVVEKKVAEDPEDCTIIVRGDVRAIYGDVWAAFKLAKDCNVKHLSLAAKEE